LSLDPSRRRGELKVPTIDDAVAFLVDYLRTPRQSSGYPSYGYDVYLPNVVAAYIVEIEGSTEHHSAIYNGARSRQLSPFFYEAAWEFSRLGVLRPGVRQFDGHAVGSSEGYSLTIRGPRMAGKRRRRSPRSLRANAAGKSFSGARTKARTRFPAASDRGIAVPCVRSQFGMLRNVRSRG
jgi:hypothetical protein